jgi:hypothetical protein
MKCVCLFCKQIIDIPDNVVEELIKYVLVHDSSIVIEKPDLRKYHTCSRLN